MLYDNLVTSEKFLRYRIKQETSEPDSPKIGKTREISFTTDLKILPKPLLMFRVDNNAPPRYVCIQLISITYFLACLFTIYAWTRLTTATNVF